MLPIATATRREWEATLGTTIKASDRKVITLPVDQLLASTLRTYAPIYQRSLNSSNLNSMKGDMVDGSYWNLALCALAFVVPPTGVAPSAPIEAFLINGNHTCEAISQAGVSQDLDFRIHVVATVEDVQALYAAYDQGKSRNSTAVNKALNFKMPLGQRMMGILRASEQWGLAGLNPGVYAIINGFEFKKALWGQDHTNEALVLEPFFDDLWKDHRDFYKRAKRAAAVALMLSVLKKGDASHKSSLNALMAGLRGLAAQPMVLRSGSTGLDAFYNLLITDERSLPKGRSSFAWGVIRAWEAHYTNQSAPTNMTALCAPIVPSQPKF